MGQLPADVGSPYLETFQEGCGGLEMSQIWSITPGDGDYMFFASNSGLGVYDGVRWEIYAPQGGSIIRSLFFDVRTKTLYSGSVNQFGKWKQDEYGKFRYTPIWTNKERGQTIEFWRLNVPINNGKHLYAQSHQMILRYDMTSHESDTIKAPTDFSYMHVVSGDIWVQAKDALYRVDIEERLHEMCTVEDRVMHAVRRAIDNRVLLFLEHKGIFVLSEDYMRMSPLNVETNALLSKAKIFTASEMGEGLYLIGTTSGGLYMMDDMGSIIKNIGESDGLPTSTVLSVGTDNRKNIWMGLDAGVSRFDSESGETYFSPKPSVGIIRSILPLRDEVYVGSNQGVFKLSPTGVFSPVENTSGSVWSMYNIGGELVYNHDLGLFRLSEEGPVLIKEGGTTTLAQSYTNPAFFVGSDYYGLSLYKMVEGKLTSFGKIKDYAGTSRHILFDKYGYLWLLSPKEGFVRITLSKDMSAVEEARLYSMSSSANKEYLLMASLDDHIVYYDGTMPYMYDARNQDLVPDKGLEELFRVCGADLTSMNQYDDVFWYQMAGNIGCVVRKGNVLEKIPGIFSHIYNKRISPFVTRLGASTYAVGYQGGMAFYRAGHSEPNHLSLRYAEGIGVGEPLYHDFGRDRFQLPYNKKILNIYPVGMNADHVVEFRVMEADTAWTKETVANFLTLTNLESGTYTIQLRNANDTGCAPAQIVVEVGVPWYISNLMIVVYLSMLGGIIYLISLFYKRKTEKEKRRIERIKQAQVEKLEKEVLSLEKDKLEIELKEKDKRLAFITMNGVKRNNLMNELKQEMLDVGQFDLSKEAKQAIRKVIKRIEGELSREDDWEMFEQYFDVVFGGLLGRLSIRYPQLSKGDLKLLACLKLNLNNKEMANLLNISYRSVEMAKYRLRKKLNLEANDNFSLIINEKN
ncbi:MAG: hypothetical protein LBN29_07990 [Mediterranea sp.]|jgi:ligand-binding sensor domain-containing protein/DNA-binding CsgD family transcriptional regulator|nr:hypothetical protein [Mediterranea sp.]